jgi:hypothetical protein
MNQTSNFKATALSDEILRTRAPSIYASGPMAGVSQKYAFVPTAEILTGLRALHWVPVEVEEQRIRLEARRGFQKHLIRLRQEAQMETLDEWNVELVVVNSHDAGCAYQLHAGIYRRICSNGLVIGGESFNAIRFRHSGCLTGEVVQASLRLVEAMPRIGERIARFRERILEPRESLALAEAALLPRYPTVAESPISPETLLQARRPEDEGDNLWLAVNRCQEGLLRGGLSDSHRDRRGKLRSVRPLRGIDSKVTVNKGLWSLAERLANGELLVVSEDVTITA